MSRILSWFIQNELGLLLRETVIKMLPSKAAVGRKVLEGEANAARQARLVWDALKGVSIIQN